MKVTECFGGFGAGKGGSVLNLRHCYIWDTWEMSRQTCQVSGWIDESGDQKRDRCWRFKFMSFGRFPGRWDQLLRSIEEEAGCGGWCLWSSYYVLSSCVLQALDGWIPIFGQWTKWGSDKLFAQGRTVSVQKVKVKSLSHVQLFATPWTSPPGFYVHGIFQARVLEWVAISFSWGFSWPKNCQANIVPLTFFFFLIKVVIFGPLDSF